MPVHVARIVSGVARIVLGVAGFVSGLSGISRPRLWPVPSSEGVLGLGAANFFGLPLGAAGLGAAGMGAANLFGLPFALAPRPRYRTITPSSSSSGGIFRGGIFYLYSRKKKCAIFREVIWHVFTKKTLF